uniref:Protein lifeguard 1 n=1 Tax=Leptobrachium leishanense TaxID=445787 RepID=A0A8C5Q9Y1_9ANUR
MSKQGDGYSDNPPSSQPIYSYSVQNPAYPAYPPSNIYHQGAYGSPGAYGSSPAPAYMPPPPMYSEQNPNVTPPEVWSRNPPGDYPQEALFDIDNGPKQDVEESPPEYTIEIGNSSAFSEAAIRKAFIRKVYITLGIQLVITVGIICMFIFWKTLKEWVQDHIYFAYGLLAALIILTVVLACCDNVRRKVPYNFIFLGIFTIVEGCVLGSISALYDAEEVMWAAGATVLVTIGLTLFALQTKWDFTIMSGGLCVVLMVLLSFGILAAILRSYWLNIVYASLGTLVFGMYLVVDTQLIVGGKHRYSISPEDYIFAALNIYLDIVNLFVLLLSLFGACR